MKNIRVIPLLHIKGPNVVKPVHTEALRVVGNPKELAGRYYEEGADEIIYLDIVASLYQRNLDFELLKSVTENIFVPVTVGGGMRTIHDINNALRAGADKVAINTYAVHHPEFLTEAARVFGSQCIVAYIEAKRQPDGMYEVYTDGGRERSGVEAIGWARRAMELGVGEILITSIDQDGTHRGYDLTLLKKITGFSQIPVIAHGGAGDPESVLKAVKDGGADAVSASSIFHYQEFGMKEVKKYLKENEVNTRSV
ncbi:MAG: imidazole glycerol phosphate synthase subunit HisF [Candidatus Niyogibacteria bacterium]|nr:MAG: imidazole glycerol phosphate synthase subunit HisF [Candidatus Niyogibacteria bacterium]